MLRGCLITYYFYPLNSIATHRTGAFARYLNTGDMKLDVLCPQWEGELRPERANVKVHYTSRRVFDANFGEVPLHGLSKVKDMVMNGIFKRKYFLSRHPGAFYKEAAAKLEEIDLGQYDFILTSYGPLDSIHIGKHIKEKYPNIKWIIDYRDVYSQLEYFDLGIFRPFFINFERNLVAKADGFITVSETLKDLLKKILPGRNGKVVYNGFDDMEFEPDRDLEREMLLHGKPVISYAGSLYNGERDIEPFLRFFKERGMDNRFSLVFAILNDKDEQYLTKVCSKIGFDSIIVKRNISYRQSLTLQQLSAFVLLFANFNGRGNGYLTGKIFEYIGMRKPVIYSGTVSDDYELYRLITKYEAGESFDKIDYATPENYMQGDCTFFHRARQTEAAKQFIEEIVTGNSK